MARTAEDEVEQVNIYRFTIRITMYPYLEEIDLRNTAMEAMKQNRTLHDPINDCAP